jgi:hypothetical protein
MHRVVDLAADLRRVGDVYVTDDLFRVAEGAHVFDAAGADVA